jgi:hypothetical protein
VLGNDHPLSESEEAKLRVRIAEIFVECMCRNLHIRGIRRMEECTTVPIDGYGNYSTYKLNQIYESINSAIKAQHTYDFYALDNFTANYLFANPNRLIKIRINNPSIYTLLIEIYPDHFRKMVKQMENSSRKDEK